MNSKNRHSSGKLTFGAAKREELSAVYVAFGSGDFSKAEYDKMPGRIAELSRLVNSGHIIRTRNGERRLDVNGNGYYRNTYRINPNLLEVLKNGCI